MVIKLRIDLENQLKYSNQRRYCWILELILLGDLIFDYFNERVVARSQYIHCTQFSSRTTHCPLNHAFQEGVAVRDTFFIWESWYRDAFRFYELGRIERVEDRLSQYFLLILLLRLRNSMNNILNHIIIALTIDARIRDSTTSLRHRAKPLNPLLAFGLEVWVGHSVN